MYEQDIARFATLIAGVGEVYDKHFTAAVVEIYWSVLKDFDFLAVKQALDRHLVNPDAGKYLPKPADIIMAIEGSTQNQALQAWSKANAAAQRIGCYTSVAFDDALIHAVIEDMGGWWKFCTHDESPFFAKEFQERYRGYVTNKPKRYPKYLVGIAESQNNASGYSHALPVFIGNQEQAKLVMASGKYGVALLDLKQLVIDKEIKFGDKYATNKLTK